MDECKPLAAARHRGHRRRQSHALPNRNLVPGRLRPCRLRSGPLTVVTSHSTTALSVVISPDAMTLNAVISPDTNILDIVVSPNMTTLVMTISPYTKTLDMVFYVICGHVTNLVRLEVGGPWRSAPPPASSPWTCPSPCWSSSPAPCSPAGAYTSPLFSST